MHPFPPRETYIENMTSERKARNTSVRLDQRDLGFKLLQTTRGTSFLFIYFSPHLFGVNNKKRSMFCTVNLAEAVKQAAVDAPESPWKWAHLQFQWLMENLASWCS